jgi:hypothetical protein
MSKFAIRLSMLVPTFRLRCRNFEWAALAICATALVVIPVVTPAQAETGRKHMHIKKHGWHRHHTRAAWPAGPAQPVVGPYSQAGPVCPGLGRSFDCKIWPPPYADDPDRKTSRH